MSVNIELTDERELAILVEATGLFAIISHPSTNRG